MTRNPTQTDRIAATRDRIFCAMDAMSEHPHPTDEPSCLDVGRQPTTPEHPLLEVNDLVCGYGKTEIVHGVSFTVRENEFACIIGANGCGKSTLLKNVLHLDKPFSGSVRISGHDTAHMNDAERAQRFAYLPQEHTPPFPFTVADVVMMGRTPHLDRFSRVSEEDREIAWRALKQLGIENLAGRTYTMLSGGQRQLVLIARCLAQQPELIIMDEPTASLDFGNQQVVLSCMRDLARTNMSVLMVTHDPHHAFLCADHVIVMQDGCVVDDGIPAAVMTRERLESIYSTPVEVVDVPLPDGTTTTVCVPL